MKFSLRIPAPDNDRLDTLLALLAKTQVRIAAGGVGWGNQADNYKISWDTYAHHSQVATTATKQSQS